ncbi:MAG TPA: carboxypeptidase-like regulatory domain-containing protein, partial [Flavobacteriaceae bacterium]|nr:carboxypeptidase-like regulatory domain-containing protein [Flavobacteriaceae bacterium]
MILIGLSFSGFSQTKIGGYIVDTEGEPMAYTNVIFINSSEGTISDENGRFYLESENTYDAVEFSFTGFKTVTLPLREKKTLNIEVVMEYDAEELGSIHLYTGKTSKKNNPAIDILRKIWANKRNNGVHQYDQYEFDKYEKLEFDINSIDSTMIKSGIFKGMEFI